MTTVTTEYLTEGERGLLNANEQVIERGLGTFMEVGRALARIRDSRLYREDHDTFEAYCQQRWGFTDRRARQMIDAATTVDSLPTGTTVPVTESQARELSGLSPDVAADVMRKAHDDSDGSVTAAAIKQARDEIAPKPQPAKATTHECARCSESFTSAVWHCDGCAGHYQPGVACPTCDAVVNTDTGEIHDTEPSTLPRQPNPGRVDPKPYDGAQLNAEQASKGLAESVILLYELTYPEGRARYVDYWRRGQIGTSPSNRAWVTPDNFRAVAAALHALADEWPHAKEQAA